MPAFTIRQSTLRGGDTLRGLPVPAVVVEPSVVEAFGPFEIVLRIVPVEVRGELLLFGHVEAELIRSADVRAPLILRSDTRARLRLAGLVESSFAFEGRVRAVKTWRPETDLQIEVEDWLILGLPWR